MAASAPVWISERDVATLLSLDDAIAVLADTYSRVAAGGAATMRRAHVRHDDSILHAVGGVLPGAGIAGTKTWLYSPRGAAPLLVLFRVDDGSVAAVIEAFLLGQLRTAATSGLGTKLLARADADVLALLGTGKQAAAQAEAVAAVRPLRRVQVFGRDGDRRERFCRRLRERLAVEVEGYDDVALALSGAGIVTSITRTSDPIVSLAMLEPGMHVNAVGAIVPGRRELDAAAVARFDAVVADSPAQAREDSGELIAAAELGELRFDDVLGLAEIVADPARGRRKPDDITLLKPLGIGISDVAIGAEVLARAQKVSPNESTPRSNAYV